MSAFINFSSSKTVVPSSLNSYDIDPVKEPMRCLDSSYTHLTHKPLQKQSCATGLTHDICTTPFTTHTASLRLVCLFHTWLHVLTCTTRTAIAGSPCRGLRCPCRPSRYRCTPVASNGSECLFRTGYWFVMMPAVRLKSLGLGKSNFKHL